MGANTSSDLKKPKSKKRWKKLNRLFFETKHWQPCLKNGKKQRNELNYSHNELKNGEKNELKSLLNRWGRLKGENNSSESVNV